MLYKETKSGTICAHTFDLEHAAGIAVGVYTKDTVATLEVHQDGSINLILNDTVIKNLKVKIDHVKSWTENPSEESVADLPKPTTRKEMKGIKEGDTFVLNGITHTASSDSHLSGDASFDEYIVYDEDGEGWSESDFPD